MFTYEEKAEDTITFSVASYIQRREARFPGNSCYTNNETELRYCAAVSYKLSRVAYELIILVRIGTRINYSNVVRERKTEREKDRDRERERERERGKGSGSQR